jgi:hypothetical protein
MKMHVVRILKTDPKDAEIKGDERTKTFPGHFANIGRLADEGNSSNGSFGNDTSYCGLDMFDIPTIEETGS